MDRADTIRLLRALAAAGMNTRVPKADAWIEKKALEIGLEGSQFVSALAYAGKMKAGWLKNAKDVVNRYQRSKAMVEKLGGRMLSVYVTTGQYDVVITVEMPNGETMLKYVAAIGASGNARTTTVRGYTPEEFSKLAAEAPSM